MRQRLFLHDSISNLDNIQMAILGSVFHALSTRVPKSRDNR